MLTPNNATSYYPAKFRDNNSRKKHNYLSIWTNKKLIVSYIPTKLNNHEYTLHWNNDCFVIHAWNDD